MRQLKGFGDEAEYLLAAADRAKKSHMDKRKAPILYSLGQLPWAAPQLPALRHMSKYRRMFLSSPIQQRS